MKELRALMIGAHNDECEYGLGGLTGLLVDRGVNVRYVNPAAKWHAAVSDEEKRETEEQEQEAARLLGAQKHMLGDRDRHVYLENENTVVELELEIHDFKPDMVFIQWPRDFHIEHVETAKASYKAICTAGPHGTRVSEVYAYQAGPNQTIDFHPDIAIDVTEAMPRVKDSLLVFNQVHANGQWLWKEKEVSAAYLGHINGFRYAETLKIVKFPEKNNDFILRTLLGDAFRWCGNTQYPACGYDFI